VNPVLPWKPPRILRSSILCKATTHSGATIFRAGDGVHATWLEQYGRILSPLARWAQSFSRYHRYILQAEAQMFTHPQLRKVICNSKDGAR
jgi:hypothetical protein